MGASSRTRCRSTRRSTEAATNVFVTLAIRNGVSPRSAVPARMSARPAPTVTSSPGARTATTSPGIRGLAAMSASSAVTIRRRAAAASSAAVATPELPRSTASSTATTPTPMPTRGDRIACISGQRCHTHAGSLVMADEFLRCGRSKSRDVGRPRGSTVVSELAARYQKVAGQFTARVQAVPDEAWDNPAPPEGWDARDVVRHLVEWVPGFFSSYAGLELATGPSVDDDPVAAWKALDDALQAALDDPGVAAREFEMRGSTYRIDQAIDMFCTGDIVVHTWDLARAAGLDETLDPDEVHTLFVGMEPMDEMLRQSGQYGPRVEVPDDADEQTKLIAFTGRRP